MDPSNHKRNVGSRNLPPIKSTFNGQMQKLIIVHLINIILTPNYCFNSFPDKPDNLKVVVGESGILGMSFEIALITTLLKQRKMRLKD